MVMEGSRRVVAALTLVGALVLAPSASARPAAQPTSLDLVKRGLARSVAHGWIDETDARRYGAITFRAVRALPRLPGSRASNLAAVLGDVLAQRDQYTA